MIYICHHCGLPIRELRTDGHEANDCLICPKCAKDLDNFLKKARDIQVSLERHFQRYL